MKVITSRDNKAYKTACKLLRKKYREEMQMYLLEGIKPLEDALDAGMDVEKVFVCEDEEKLSEKIPKEKTLVLSRQLFGALSDTENPQGIIAQIRMKEPLAEDLIAFAKEGDIVILDRLQDPGNVGTIIRTAEAAGIRGIIGIKGTADPYSPKVVRSAAGSIMRMPMLTGIDEKEALELIKRGGWKLAVTSVSNGTSCFEGGFAGNLALVIGNEGSGVSKTFEDRADIRLMIPMEGSIESLNASVAAGILMYQIRK